MRGIYKRGYLRRNLRILSPRLTIARWEKILRFLHLHINPPVFSLTKCCPFNFDHTTSATIHLKIQSHNRFHTLLLFRSFLLPIFLKWNDFVRLIHDWFPQCKNNWPSLCRKRNQGIFSWQAIVSRRDKIPWFRFTKFPLYHYITFPIPNVSFAPTHYRRLPPAVFPTVS